MYIFKLVLNLWTLLVLCFLINLTISQEYDREALQEKYPGFGTEWIPMGQDENGEMIIGYLNDEGPRFDIVPDPKESLVFTYFSRSNQDGIEINSDDALNHYDPTKPTKFVTHGWLSGGTKDTCILIKNGFLEKYDANVFIMDWSKIADIIFYPIPMRMTSSVGEQYSLFLNKLIDRGADASHFHLVGHSLGAHVSGFAARKVKAGKVGRVTGLDPALPGFTIGLVEDGRLGQEDANFVDIIHTSSGYLGIKVPIGHADFYPNGGGPPQPGCESIQEMIEACSHGLSWKLFAESLHSLDTFLAQRCSSFEEFLRPEHCAGETIPMGDPVPETARGEYYLVTDRNSPYFIPYTEVNNLLA